MHIIHNLWIPTRLIYLSGFPVDDLISRYVRYMLFSMRSNDCVLVNIILSDDDILLILKFVRV